MKTRKLFLRCSLATLLVALLFIQLSAAAQPDAGFSLRFDGVDDYVSIPHDPALNAFPLTISAWIKTARVTNVVDGIISKYADASFNGYSLNLRNGNLYGWYLRAGSGGVLGGPSGVDGGFIADGQWHHIAFVISPSGGVLYVDGNLRGSAGWTISPGPATSAKPLQFGRYDTYPNSFQGELDEITLWNRALTANELNYLKYRRLSGSEDGLVGYWKLNEASGLIVNNAATNAFNGTLLNGVNRTDSHAAIALQPVATNCLRFDGTNGYVQVPHHAALNSYPFTVTTWFRATNAAAEVQGIVSKYADASGNGWTLVVQGGKLRAFYLRSFSNIAMDITSPGTVADGGWHHAAVVVDASGGKLFLDGALVGSNAWTGVAGAATSTEPLQIGRYSFYPNRFVGTIDEVTIWDRALTATELQANKNLRLVGNESGLVAYWRFDEGTGTTTADVTGHGHTGTLISNPAWTGSTAYLGDGSVHLILSPGTPSFTHAAVINTVPGQTAFAITARSVTRRIYDFGNAPANLAVTNRLEATLRIADSGTVISTLPATSSTGNSMSAYNASAPQPLAGSSVLVQSVALNLQPSPGVQLDSVNHLHEAVTALSHNENGGSFTSDGTDASAPTRLLHFNGHLLFGNVDTILTNLLTSPLAKTNFAPAFQQSEIQIATDGAFLALAPSVKFGGLAFNVNLGANGIATNANGTFNLAAPEAFFETSGIRYRLPNLVLNTNGATATGLEAWFPTGFGMQTSTNSRVHIPFAAKTNITLSGSLVPTTSPIVFTAADYHTNLLWFSEETKPLLIGAAQIEWRIPEGEFFIPQAQAIHFVREVEDRDLQNQRGNLVEPLAADRISNDAYYRHAIAIAGAPVFIRPNNNGAALMTLEVGLQENEYRPHFPYLNRDIGGHIPVVGGSLVISNDLIAPASYLMLAGPAPIPYARDCGPDANCVGAPSIGAQVQNFTAPAGHLGLGELSFTPDGGLLAYGSIPPTNLTWGFISGSDFAQRTSDVQIGALHIPGTFLRGDQIALPNAQRPAALLFTGWGNAASSRYVERPGTGAYADGFANYAGLNFRAPMTGRSFIAGQDTGNYPLTSRSKYYTRFGGVSGIHESASFPSNLALYGYAFTFTTYRLSFLDSDNWESRTDGKIKLPNPSDFTVEFERLKFLCRGNLDSAQLPASIDTKHMVYWNTDIQPLSLQFKPKTGDSCFGLRFLVLGVETKLPFIPQAFQAALGFKANGNLTTLATDLEGIDSRFAVPANLQLQGPGGSTYPLTTAARGYFNNWETAGRPAAGFYNLVARVRVPFFRDTKVQLHVTPITTNAAQISIMGGWPAEAEITANRGWHAGTQDYFNAPGFDANHDGWPAGVSLNDYRNSPDESFRPRAQRNWIDVALFDYPLTWNPVLREFSGFVPAKVILPVIDVDSSLKELTPGKVDLDFAQDLNVQLPRIKVLDLANDALNEINAPINTLSNAIRGELSSAISATGLTSGFRSLQGVLRENAEGFFRPVLEPALNPIVDNLYTALAQQMAGGKANLLAKTPAIIAAGSNQLQNAIMNLNGAVGQANSVLGKLDSTLGDVDDTLGLFIRVLEKDGSGNRHVVRAVIQKLADDQGPALGFLVNMGDSLVNDLLANLEPTLAKVESDLRDLRGQFNQVRMQVGRVATDNDFADALDHANHTSATLQNFIQLAGGNVSSLLSAAVGPTGDYFTADPARAKREIRERLIVSFLSSQMSADYQTTFRQFLYDKDFLLDQLMDVLFDQINRSIRDGLSSQIAGAQDGIFKNMKGGGAMSGSLLSAKIRGAPTFEGDSLRKIHLDSDIKMNLPDEMNFTAYMDIKELNSQSTALSCIPAGAPAAEVTLGARDVPLDWLGVSGGTPLTLSVEARWTLQSGAVLGVGGSVEVKGKVGFKGCSLNDFGATLAIGQTENYFAAKAGATVLILGIPVNFTAGIFAGKACSLDPLLFIDPEAPQVLIVDASDFSGVYLQFGGGLSLSDILFGESSCLLDVGANITSALYYQGGPRLGSIGGRQKVGVNVDLICIISASAEWATAIRIDSVGKLTVQGQARLCGKVGWCPACLKACKTLVVTGVLTDSGIDYDVDF